MRVAVFLTTTAERGRDLLARERQLHADAQFAVFVRDDDRDALAGELAGCDVRRDKPAGGKLRFLRALRRERFDAAVVAWHGTSFQPLRLAALFCGAPALHAVDERGKRFPVRWWAPWTWAAHALRRLVKVRALQLLGAVAAVYRATVGLLVASVCLLPSLFRAARLSAQLRSKAPAPPHAP